MPKRIKYFHSKLLIPVGFFGICTFFAYINIIAHGFSLFNILILLSSLALTVFGLFSIWKYRFFKEPKPIRQQELKFDFNDDSIILTQGYYFRHSSIYKSQRIKACQISEVTLNTSPPSIVINNNEVIFLGYEDLDQLREFSERNSLEESERVDIWELLNQPFLDTEFSEEEKSQTLQRLRDNGLTKYEIKTIRKRIGRIMWLYTWSMEWAYLGQMDYLRLSFESKKRYWWSMGIALRNFKKSGQH